MATTPQHQRRFAKMVSASDRTDTYLVRGEEHGKKAWYYVKVERGRLPSFKKAMKAGEYNLTDYGEILSSGWGENPPAGTTG